MQTIVTTAGMPPRDGFECFHNAVIAQISRHDTMVPLDHQHFHAEMKTGSLADLTLVCFEMTGATRHSPSGYDGELVLHVPTTRFVISFDNRQVEVNGKGLLLADYREPSSAVAPEPLVDHIVLRIPRATLAQRIPIGKEVTNRLIPRRGDAVLLANFIRSIKQTGPSTLSPAARVVAREQALDLTALALGPFAGVTPELTSPARTMVVKLRAAIESRLTDLTADRASIAGAAGISERHANRLLAQEGTSITELLRKRRLAKCREALEQSDRGIDDIARDFGWTLANNFSRDFKQEFGLTPRQARLLIHTK